MSTPTLLSIGVDQSLLDALQDPLKFLNVVKIPFDLKKLREIIQPLPSIILFTTDDFKTGIEAAQNLRMTYPSAAIFNCCNRKDAFERKEYIQNGANDAFLIPMETHTLRLSLVECISHLHTAQKAYRSVNMLDIQEGEILEFDTSVYMPSNNKYVKISAAGSELDAERLAKIRKNNIHNLHVPLEQIQRFYEFSAKKLRKIDGAGSTLSATERREKLTSSVRELMTGLFSSQNTSFEAGQDVMQNCKGIVSSYILQGPNASWYLRIQQVLGEFSDHYSHSSNTSALAALFSMGLGIGKPEDLALAGLLHDIGESHLPPEIQALEVEDMTKDQLESYKKHPEYSAEIIQSRKIIVPEIVMKIILQHHENFDGSGYPRGYIAAKFSDETQILSLADEFDQLTKLRPGKTTIAPLAAVQQMMAAQATPNSPVKFDPELLQKLLDLFTTPPTN